jgi:hypothetical protein
MQIDKMKVVFSNLWKHDAYCKVKNICFKDKQSKRGLDESRMG